MTNPKVPAKRTTSMPSVFSDVTSPTDNLPAGNHWFGFQGDVIASNTNVVNVSTGYLGARRAQSDALASLIDARMRVARKYAELADLPNVIGDEQREREHVRGLAENRRVLERIVSAHAIMLAMSTHETNLSKQREQAVRAQRNHDAAVLVSPEEINHWRAEARARANNALADEQDTAADLRRATPSHADPAENAAFHLADTLALLDNEIELAKQRGNAAAVLVLQNARPRLKSAA